MAASVLLIGAAEPGTLDLELTGLRSQKGVVQVCLTRDAARFPECDKLALRTMAAAQPLLRIEGLAAGSYAVSLFHDENRNGRLDTTMGIPREGFGFSRNPPIRFGPPKFDAARFTVGAGTTHQQVHLKYLL